MKSTLKQTSGGNKIFKIGLPLVIVAVVAGIGLYTLLGSKAASMAYYQVLNYKNAAQGGGVSTKDVAISNIGAQTVSVVPPGAHLDLMIYGKAPIQTTCFFVMVEPQTGSTSNSAVVEFASVSNAKTVTMAYEPTQAGKLRQVCVSPGSQATKAYNVHNKSKPNGALVYVYQTLVRQ